MGYPDQKDDRDHVPVEDSERLVGDDESVAGRVIEPDEDRLVRVDPGEPLPPPGDGLPENGKHRYTGDPDEPAAADDQVVLESSEAGPVSAAPAGETVASASADGGPDRVGQAIPMPGAAATGEPESARAETAGAETAGAEPAGAEPYGAEPDGTEPYGAGTAGAEMAGAEMAGPAGPADVTSPDPLPESAAAPPAAPAASGDWHEIMAMFVDDPRAATERAARIVDGSVEELVRSLKNETDTLRSAWQGGSADTERLRTALKDYRLFWQRLDSLAHRG